MYAAAIRTHQQQHGHVRGNVGQQALAIVERVAAARIDHQNDSVGAAVNVDRIRVDLCDRAR